MDIIVDVEKCTKCKACIESCPVHLFSMGTGSVEVRNEEGCMECGHCVSVCPVDAVHHTGLNLTDFLPCLESFHVSPDTLYHFLRSRRSCRTYEEREVSRKVLDNLIDIGRYAPTGTNIQDVEFLVIQDQGRIARLSKMAGAFYGEYVQMLESSNSPIPYQTARRMNAYRLYNKFSIEGKDRIFRGGKALILVHGPEANAVAPENCHYALFHIVLMAHAMGLGTCLSRTFVLAAEHSPEIQIELECPTGNKLFGCVGLGYPKYNFHKLPARKDPKIRWL